MMKHYSVLLHESIDNLAIHSDGIYVDTARKYSHGYRRGIYMPLTVMPLLSRNPGNGLRRLAIM